MHSPSRPVSSASLSTRRLRLASPLPNQGPLPRDEAAGVVGVFPGGGSVSSTPPAESPFEAVPSAQLVRQREGVPNRRGSEPDRFLVGVALSADRTGFLPAAVGQTVEMVLDERLACWERTLADMVEPALRASARRALAEHLPLASSFRRPDWWDRAFWRLLALFTSRTYHDVVFLKTRRFQVEEVFLIRAETMELISYASTDPVRHANPGRVKGTFREILKHLGAREPGGPEGLVIGRRQWVVIGDGGMTIMVAAIKGAPNTRYLDDLKYIRASIEGRYGNQLRAGGEVLLFDVQPALEDALLVHSPIRI